MGKMKKTRKMEIKFYNNNKRRVSFGVNFQLFFTEQITTTLDNKIKRIFFFRFALNCQNDSIYDQNIREFLK